MVNFVKKKLVAASRKVTSTLSSRKGAESMGPNFTMILILTVAVTILLALAWIAFKIAAKKGIL